MEENNEKPKRSGIHKFIHISMTDAYISAVLSGGFFILLLVKFFNRILDWGIKLSYITWVDTMQLAVLWGILGFASQAYYEKYERKYDK